MFAIDADSKCGEAGVIEVSEQFVREALEAKDQLKRAQRKLDALQDAVMALNPRDHYVDAVAGVSGDKKAWLDLLTVLDEQMG